MNLQNKLREIEAKVQLIKTVTEAIYSKSRVPYPDYFWGDFKGVTQDGAFCEDFDNDKGYIPLEWLEMSDEDIKVVIAKKFEAEQAKLNDLALNREKQLRDQRLQQYRQLKVEFGNIE